MAGFEPRTLWSRKRPLYQLSHNHRPIAVKHYILMFLKKHKFYFFLWHDLVVVALLYILHRLCFEAIQRCLSRPQKLKFQLCVCLKKFCLFLCKKFCANFVKGFGTQSVFDEFLSLLKSF